MHASTGLVDGVAGMAKPWATLYRDHGWVQTTVIFVHLAGIFLGGGFAIATDRETFVAHRAARLSGQMRQLTRLHTIHRPVMLGLALALGSGFLLSLADVEHFARSGLFWTKMVLLGFLLTNGYLLTRTETALRQGEPANPVLWARLSYISAASIGLWLALILIGTMLTGQ